VCGLNLLCPQLEISVWCKRKKKGKKEEERKGAVVEGEGREEEKDEGVEQ
jgi:hypothetical protein